MYSKLAVALAIGILILPISSSAIAQDAVRSPSPEGARIYFIDLHDGSVVQDGAIIHFGLRGMGVAPAGLDKANTGHHHLLIDDAALNPPLGAAPIPSDDEHVHFGNGQTEFVLHLPPGRHSLRLLLGDADHVPHDPPIMSKVVVIKVVAAKTVASQGKKVRTN